MEYSKSWTLYALFSFSLHTVVLFVSKGFWAEPDSITFVDLAKTQSLSYCTPIGYPIFLFIFGISTKFLWLAILVQIALRSIVTALIIDYFIKKHRLTLKKSLLLWIIFHVEPQQIYYNICLMAESLLITVFLAQWYVWQMYQDTKKIKYLWFLFLLVGAGLYLKPIAIVSVILLLGHALLNLKTRYKLLLGGLLVYVFFYVSVSSVYYWRYGSFEPDLFKGILFWNNASILTPALKKDRFYTKDLEISSVLEMMYSRKSAEYAFEQDDNRIFEDSSFTQQYIQYQMKQGKTYRQAIVYTNALFGKVAKQIVWHYPISFVYRYIIPNAVEWLRALSAPHAITSYVPPQVTHIHTHAKAYSPQYLIDNLHSTTKLIFLMVGIAGSFILMRKKQQYNVFSVVSIGLFIATYIVLNIVLHPLEYRYICPVLAAMQLLNLHYVAITK